MDSLENDQTLQKTLLYHKEKTHILMGGDLFFILQKKVMYVFIRNENDN